MIHLQTRDFDLITRNLHNAFVNGDAKEVRTKNWQGLDVTDREEMVPWELTDVTIGLAMLNMVGPWQTLVGPNLPWAEEHFLERVSGIPHNPPPSHVNWPHAQTANREFAATGKFSHTYPERFWPKFAENQCEIGLEHLAHRGIRFYYGDLMDVVHLMERDPYTRQAYLPVFFPEDTGAHHKERIPCTLGYLFRYRERTLDIVYYIRSCDFRRHFRDDVYMAGRLAQWMLGQLRNAEIDDPSQMVIGQLTMHIGSLHVFAGDLPLMSQEKKNDLERNLRSVW